MSGKNLNLKWGHDKDKDKEMPAKETVGLFRGVSEGPSASSFVSLQDSLPATQVASEFGQVTSHAGPDVGGKHGLATRFFSFGRRGSTKDKEHQPTQRSVSAPKTATISSPIASSFQKVDQATVVIRSSESSVRLGSLDHTTSPPNPLAPLPQSPSSPASPRSVKRKPVPGIAEAVGERAMRPSDSLSSMRSFVLEDPPKGRPKNLA
jgi:hypothetical protein